MLQLHFLSYKGPALWIRVRGKSARKCKEKRTDRRRRGSYWKKANE